MPEPGEYGRGVSQEDVGGADSAVDYALMMEILQSVAEVPENQADKELGQPLAEGFLGQEVPHTSKLSQGGDQPHLLPADQAGKAWQDVGVLELLHGGHLVLDLLRHLFVCLSS